MAFSDIEQQRRFNTDGQPFLAGQASHLVFGHACRSAPNGNQVVQPHHMNGYHFGCEFSDRRRANDTCHSLQRNLCLLVGNVALTCGVVIGLLFLLKHLNSPLLRTEGHNDSSGALPKLSFDQTLIEKIVKETISAQLSTSPNQRNVSSGNEKCSALLFLSDKHTTTTTPTGRGFFLIRGWAELGNVAYMIPGCLNYSDSTGEVTINHPGYYLVYTHLAFTGDVSNDPSVKNASVLGHEIRVQKVAVDDIDPIATDTRVNQPNSSQMRSVVSYNSRAMAILYLPYGAKVTVHAKAPTLVLRGNTMSSFGLYRL